MLGILIDISSFSTKAGQPPQTTIAIWNVSNGDGRYGDYRYAISHSPNSAEGRRAASETGSGSLRLYFRDLANSGPWVRKSGIVRHRRSVGSLGLLAAVLRHAEL